jgi:hypothetical protein
MKQWWQERRGGAIELPKRVLSRRIKYNSTLPLWEGQTAASGLGRGSPLPVFCAFGGYALASHAYPSPKFTSRISTLPQGEGGFFQRPVKNGQYFFALLTGICPQRCNCLVGRQRVEAGITRIKSVYR